MLLSSIGCNRCIGGTWPRRVGRIVVALALCNGGSAQEMLYNGIQLPAQWPPIRQTTQEPSTPTYLQNPPAVIPIDTGRQLFVDNFLIADTNLSRTAHRPVFYNRNPVLKPGEWPDPTFWAFPYSDGVWFDPADQLYKMWYLGGNAASVSYAYSSDGIQWTRPNLNVVMPSTNRVLDLGGGRDSTTVWMDLEDPDPLRKFKAFIYIGGARLEWYTSPNGINWTKQPNQILTLNDRTTFFWNPFRRRWVNNIRGGVNLPAAPTRPAITDARARYYSESTDLINWSPSDPRTAFWLAADENDPPYYPGGQPPQLYHLDAVAYESVMLGLFSFLHPGPEETPGFLPAPNLVEMGVGFSRDGFQWDRPTRGFGPTAFIPAANKPDAWDGYNTQSVGGNLMVVGDQLRFYFSGRSKQHYEPWPITPSATGLAILRRDGFYSMDAGASEGTLTTRPVRFAGNRLFVNVNNPQGILRAEILDANDNVIAPFSKANSIGIGVDETLIEMKWQGAADLAALAGQTVKFRFFLTNGELYSFWVSPNATGASNGYVGAGGPGFTGPTDTIGNLGPTGGIDIQPPTATMAEPTAGSAVSGLITLRATAQDNVGVTQVQFVIDGENFGAAVTAAPYQISLDTTTLVPGEHTITAVAEDAELNRGASDPVTVTVTAGTPPVISGGQPAGTLPVGTVETTLGVTTNETAVCRYGTQGGVSYPAKTLAMQTANGLAHTSALTGLSAGTHRYYVRCAGSSGAYNLSDYEVEFSIAADTVAPSVTILSPGASLPLTGEVQISASATDNVGVVGVQFTVDEQIVGAEILAPPFAVSWNTAAVSNGPHRIAATARDAAGNTTTATRDVTVSNLFDLTAPVLSGGQPSGLLPLNTTQTTISVITNEPASCRYSGSTGVAFGSMTGSLTSTDGLTHSAVIGGLSNGGTYRFYVRCQDSLLNTNATDFPILFDVASAPVVHFTQFVQAESGTPVSPMRLVKDGGTQYLRTTMENDGTVAYYLTVAAPVRLRVYGRVQSQRIGYGSFYLSMDGAPEQLWALGQQLRAGATWEWLPVTGPGGLREFDLSEGTHVFRFRGGNVNTYLDALVFTSDPTLIPALPTALDTLPPERSNPLPLGALPAGTTQAELSLSTNEFATCRYSTNPTRPFELMENVFAVTGGLTHQAPLANLGNGAHFAYLVRCIDAAGNVNPQDFQIYFSVASPGQAATHYSQFVEAETGVLTPPMYVTVGDTSASGAKFIRSSSSNVGTSSYLVAIPAAGSYRLWGRLQLMASVPPKFYVSIDGQPEDLLTGQAAQPWHWRETTLQNGAPRSYALTAGIHTITIRSGTGNSYLDQLFLTNDPATNPGGGTSAIVISNPSPSGVLPASISQISMNVTTNRAATCRFADTAGVAFASMPQVFSTTGSVQHSTLLTGLISSARYTFFVRCGDGSTTSEETRIEFSVADGIAPQISIESPAANQTVSGTVPLLANASDNDGIAGVRFFLDGNALGSEVASPPYSLNWDSKSAGNGSHTLTAAALDHAGNVASTAITIFVSNTSPTGPGGDSPEAFQSYAEAEDAFLTLPMSVLQWGTASNGQYIRSNTTNLGTASLSFTVPSAGDYFLWGRIYSPNPNFDSYWVSVDGGAEDLWDAAEGLWKTAWQWTRVTGRTANGGIPSLQNTNPRIFHLSAGTHTFRFRGADSYTYLDRIVITNDSSFVPQ